MAPQKPAAVGTGTDGKNIGSGCFAVTGTRARASEHFGISGMTDQMLFQLFTQLVHLNASTLDVVA